MCEECPRYGEPKFRERLRSRYVGLDDDERSPPSGPQVTEPRPEQPVNGPQPRAPAGLSLQDRSLMTKRRVLNLERRLALQA